MAHTPARHCYTAAAFALPTKLLQIVHVRQPGSLEMRQRSVRQLSGELEALLLDVSYEVCMRCFWAFTQCAARCASCPVAGRLQPVLVGIAKEQLGSWADQP